MARLRKLRQALPGAIALAAILLLAPGGAAASGGEGIEIFPDVPTSWDRIFSLELFASPLVQLLALFALLIWPANQLLWRPLLRVFEARGERIAGSRARAEKVASEAEDVLGAYESAVERARRSADGDRAQILEGARRQQSQLTAEARRAAETEVTAAREAVDAALDRARSGLQSSADELGREAAAQVLGRTLS
jgi:F0F1-type ATP synthase membrane subunit b/b'